jgi:hypothetical protein
MARFWISPNGRKIKCESHKAGATEIVMNKFLKEYLEVSDRELDLPFAERKATTAEDFLYYIKHYMRCDDNYRDYSSAERPTKQQKDTLFELTGIWIE